MSTTKKHLTVHEGGGKTKSRPQVERPLLMAVVPASQISSKTLRASDYLGVDRSRPRKKPGDGRSRNHNELEVLKWAKYWHRDMIRFARHLGYTDVKKFFQESKDTTTTEKKLFFTIQALIDNERTL